MIDDSEGNYTLYVIGRNYDPKKQGWCATCKWVMNAGVGVNVCPFPEGTCARIAGTIEKPDKWKCTERVKYMEERRRYYAKKNKR